MSNIAGKLNPKYKDGRCSEKHYCVDCGLKEISYPNWLYGKQRCFSCSLKTRFGKTNPNYRKGITLKQHYCECGKTISLTNVRDGLGKCTICSKLGEKNPQWQGGKSFEPYSPEWSSELKEQIRKRDNYECQNCSMTEEEHLIVTGKVLAVHHIDYDKQNCKEDNLITLCNQCNTRANFNRDYWKDFYSSK